MRKARKHDTEKAAQRVKALEIFNTSSLRERKGNRKLLQNTVLKRDELLRCFSVAYAVFISFLAMLHNREYVYAIYIHRSGSIGRNEKAKSLFFSLHSLLWMGNKASAVRHVIHKTSEQFIAIRDINARCVERKCSHRNVGSDFDCSLPYFD